MFLYSPVDVETVDQRLATTDGTHSPEVARARQEVRLTGLRAEDLDDLTQVLGEFGVHHDGEITDLAIELQHGLLAVRMLRGPQVANHPCPCLCRDETTVPHQGPQQAHRRPCTSLGLAPSLMRSEALRGGHGPGGLSLRSLVSSAHPLDALGPCRLGGGTAINSPFVLWRQPALGLRGVAQQIPSRNRIRDRQGLWSASPTGQTRTSQGVQMRLRLIGVVSVALTLSGYVFASPTYKFSILSAPGSTYSVSAGINNAGAVVGSSNYAGNAAQHATVWKDGVATDLDPAATGLSAGFGINDAGQAVGYDSATRPTVWADGGATTLGPLQVQYPWGVGFAINAVGQVAGRSPSFGGNVLTYHATVWNNGVATDLGRYGQVESGALGLNDRGQVVGFSDFVGSSVEHAALWNGTVATDLGTLGGARSSANAINNAGLVVGGSSVAGSENRHATLWADGAVIDLGTLGGIESTATDINELGQIVGYGAPISGFYSHAMIWSGVTAIDLNDLVDSGEWELETAFGINDHGWITGGARNTSTGVRSPYLLKTEVPEPSTLALVLAALAGGVAVRGRK